MKRVNLLILLLLLTLTLTVGCSGNLVAPQVNTIKVGVILPLSGELSSKAESHKVALETALGTVNEYLNKSENDFKIELVLKDSESNPDNVPQILEDFKTQGINICIGPLSSEEAMAAKPFVDKENMLLLSPASSAPSLAVEDNIYRFMPNDIVQADAIATLLQSKDVMVLIPVYRDDNYGRDFSKEIKQTNKLIVTNGFTYKTDGSDISEVVRDLAKGIALLQEENIELSKIAVVTVGYGEVRDILKAADTYDNLKKISWVGTDGIALNNDIFSDADAMSFINAVNFSASAFGVDQTSYFNDVLNEVTEALGRRPDTESLISYDILWIIASLYERLGIDAAYDALRANLIEAAKLNPGASGWMLLDENGDRKYFIYEFWSITNSTWECVGKYRRDPGHAGFVIYK